MGLFDQQTNYMGQPQYGVGMPFMNLYGQQDLAGLGYGQGYGYGLPYSGAGPSYKEWQTQKGVFSGISAAASLVGGLYGQNSHDKYASLLESQNLTMPQSIPQAEGMARSMASNGLVGYEKYKADILNNVAGNTAQAKELGSGNSVLKLLSDSISGSNDAIQNLDIQDENAKRQNQMQLINFLTTVKAPYEQRIQEFDLQKKMAAEQERMAGDKENQSGIMDTIGSLAGLVTMFI